MPFTRDSAIIRTYFPYLSSVAHWVARCCFTAPKHARPYLKLKEKSASFFNAGINIPDIDGYRVIRNGKEGHNKCHRIDRKIEADPIKIQDQRSRRL